MSVSEVQVRFGRRSTRGLILGFSAPRVLAMAIAGVVAVGGMVADNGVGLILSAVVWAPVAPPRSFESADVRRWNGPAPRSALAPAKGPARTSIGPRCRCGRDRQGPWPCPETPPPCDSITTNLPVR